MGLGTSPVCGQLSRDTQVGQLRTWSGCCSDMSYNCIVIDNDLSTTCQLQLQFMALACKGLVVDIRGHVCRDTQVGHVRT